MLVAAGDTPIDPAVATVPDQASDAVQEVAPADDKVSVLLPPVPIEFGSADNEIVGGAVAGGTSTETDSEVVPPAPLQESE